MYRTPSFYFIYYVATYCIHRGFSLLIIPFLAILDLHLVETIIEIIERHALLRVI